MKGLGKGLGALLMDAELEYNGSFGGLGISDEIPLEQVFPNPDQPRKVFDETAMTELVNSIRVHGVISPIIVVRMEFERYMIIAGERRWRAAGKAGLKTIPAIVRAYNEREIKEISLIDNLQRENLNPIETAQAIKELMEQCEYTQDKVAERIGKSRSSVANTLRLLTLCPEVVAMVSSGALSAGHARCLVPVEDKEEQIELAKKGGNDKMSVREFERLIKRRFTQKAANEGERHSLELKDLIQRMQHVMGTKVSLIGTEKRGRIYIDYFTKDDLDRVSELIAKLELDQ